MSVLKGKSIFEGIVIGNPYFRKKANLNIKEYDIDESQVEFELEKFRGALGDSKNELRYLKKSLKGKVDDDEIRILNVHLMIMDDPVLLSEINKGITNDLKNVESVVDKVVNKYAEMLEAIKDPVYKQRAMDIKDVGEKLINHLMAEDREVEDLDGKILLAKEVFPSELLKIHNKGIRLKGIVTEHSGETSHVAILARALEIPMLVGVKNLHEREWDKEVILDTRMDFEVILTTPSSEERESYEKMIEKYLQEKIRYEKLKDLPSVTKDGVKINLYENTGGSVEISGRKKLLPPDGIGLLRSEFIYLEAEFFPSEEDQKKIYEEIYMKMVEDHKDKSMVIRTLDIGADKQLGYYEMPEEENPSLGLRGLRFTLSHQNIFKEQLRAILRAAYNKNIKIMFPMVTNIDELEEAKKILEESKKELLERGEKYKGDIEVGIMIEVPSAVIMADLLAENCDFFSIGSNDLTQYMLATDRQSDQVGHLYNEHEPALLRCLEHIAKIGRKHSKKVSVCGEMAGDPLSIIALLSFGITDLSMSPSSILRAKSIVRAINFKELKELRKKILTAKRSKEIKTLLREYYKKIKKEFLEDEKNRSGN